MEQLVFILSTGRTGTKFLAEFLNSNYEDVVALHEPKPSYLLRIYSHAYLDGKVSSERMARLLRRKRRRLLQAVAANRLYVESNPFLVGFIDVLDSLTPEPIIIHIVRDPREFVRSAINHGSATGKKKLASTLIPCWFPNVRGVLDCDRQEKISPIARFAGQWVLVNRKLAQSGKRYPGYHLLRYEDIFDEHYSGLRQLCRILGLEFPDASESRVAPSQRINRSRLQQIGRWQNWTRAQCAELHRICTPLMQQYGYGHEADWLARVSAPVAG